MSNFAVNPILVDVAMSSSFRTSYPLAGGFPSVLRIQKIIWFATAAGTVTLNDPVSGDAFATLQAEAAGPVSLNFDAAPRLVRDFIINTLPNGYVEIYLV